MIPSSADPRRPDRVQRYKPPTANGGASGEDLTPDYMNILGPEPTTANAEGGETLKTTEPTEDGSIEVPTTNATNVIPTSPQYGVAIIPNVIETPVESVTPVTDTITETTAKVTDENKDPHSTPSRNDRFKVVKIASLEPFKRGRWKCMDYVDEAPPATTQTAKVQPQQMGGVYLQTQSLPQQHIQQMLMQGGYTNPAGYYTGQMIPHTQYFYPQGAIPGQNLPQQLMSVTGVPPNSIPQQFITAGQPYYQQNTSGFTMPQQNYQNVQYVVPNTNSAFVPTSQNISQLQQNFQQSQTYAGQPNVTQHNVVQPMVNGHAFPSNEQTNRATNLPTQVGKSVVLNSSMPPQQLGQTNVVQNQNQAGQVPVQVLAGNQQTMPLQNQQYNQIQGMPYQSQNFIQVTHTGHQVSQSTAQPQPTNINQVSQAQPIPNASQTILNPVAPSITVSANQPVSQNFPNSVYTNPQFVASVNSLPNLEGNNENLSSVAEGQAEAAVATEAAENADDPAKTNPVVNAIDNKIEQAMDLVKSHLMYTVREEVEVLKEKIAELMERIQQLETENNFLRSQIPKNQNASANNNPDPPPSQ